MARFKDTVQIGRVQTRTGAPESLMSLADRLRNFSEFGTQLAVAGGAAFKKQQIEKGITEAGQVPLVRKDGVTQAPEFKEEPFFGTGKAQAHNKALRAAYLASLDNDNREQINNIFLQNSDNLLKFNDEVEGYTKGVVSNVDPSVAQAVAHGIARTVSLARTRVQRNEFEKQENIARGELIGNIDSATVTALRESRNGNKRESAEAILSAAATIDAGVEAGYWTPQKGAEQKRALNRTATEQSLMSEVDGLAQVDMKKAFERVDELAGKVRKGWSPDEWRSFLIEAQQDLHRKNARKMSDLKKITKEAEQQESIDRGIAFTNPGIPADPARGSQDRKDVNAAYDVEAKEWVDLPPAEQFEKNIEFIKNTGIIPNKVSSGISATMRSGTPDQTFVFSKLVEEIAKDPKSANILRDVPAESRAISKQISDSMEAGIDLETSIEVARKNTFGLTEPERERIKIETQALRPELVSILEDKVDDEFDPSFLPFFGEEPDVNPALQADFNVAVEKFMTLTGGDSGQATTLAFEAIKKTWGSTTIGAGKRFMKYSPEVFYSVQGVDDKWMSKQFDDDMKALGVNPKDATIVSDFETSKSETPSWPIWTTDADGVSVPLFDEDGSLLTWAPDFKQTREFFKLRGLPAKQTEKARQLREMQRSFEGIIFLDDKFLKSASSEEIEPEPNETTRQRVFRESETITRQ